MNFSCRYKPLSFLSPSSPSHSLPLPPSQLQQALYATPNATPSPPAGVPMTPSVMAAGTLCTMIAVWPSAVMSSYPLPAVGYSRMMALVCVRTVTLSVLVDV